ncbi:unnamed protein product [Pedinophyceae sp. YPF-701]|nr:unnamed protein product [Pedinophyceae sp. YPF-701]
MSSRRLLFKKHSSLGIDRDGESEKSSSSPQISAALEVEAVVGRKNSLTMSQKNVLTEFANMWQDVEIRFDTAKNALSLLPGEAGLATLHDVQDAKCQTTTPGILLVTNLRIVWVDKSKSKALNLSIGLGTVLGVKMDEKASRTGGETTRVELLCRFNQSKYHFIFLSSNPDSRRNFAQVRRSWKAYGASKAHRELRLRANVVEAGELVALPKESVVDWVPGVMNLANDQGNLGSFIVTNLRVIWFAQHNESFNVSMPYITLLSVRVRSSKFGQALVLEATPRGGGYLLGFRIEPDTRLMKVFEQIRMVWKNALNGPNLGTSTALSQIEQDAATREIEGVIEDVEIVDSEEAHDTLLAYILDPGSSASRVPVLSRELGVAIEPLKASVTLEDLWSVV